MMRQIIVLSFFAALTLLCGCGEKLDPKAQAMVYLTEARVLLANQRYDAARDTAYAIRNRFPKAIVAREQAMLLIDSIEIMAAEDSLRFAEGDAAEELSMRAEFYRRRLAYDIEQLQMKRQRTDTNNRD